ncbi:MAG: alpha/beta hydrolase [Anaerolineales bacterium]
MTMETIEHNVQQPAVRAHQTPILFQHGAWHGAWCWQLWMDYFASLGYEVHSFSLPAHGKSPCNKGHINSYTFADYVETLASQIEAISPKPVVIGHSMGGAILQKYLENHQLPGAVLLATLPAAGMFAMGQRSSWVRPGSFFGGMLKFNMYEWVRTPKLAQDLFLDPKTEIDTVAFQKQLVSETTEVMRSLVFPFAKVNSRKSPIFVIAGEKDAIFTVDEERKTAAKYGAKIVVIDGQAHNLMMESAWKQVADIIDNWITHELALP